MDLKVIIPVAFITITTIVTVAGYSFWYHHRCPSGGIHNWQVIAKKRFESICIETKKCKKCNFEVIREY